MSTTIQPVIDSNRNLLVADLDAHRVDVLNEIERLENLAAILRLIFTHSIPTCSVKRTGITPVSAVTLRIYASSNGRPPPDSAP